MHRRGLQTGLALLALALPFPVYAQSFPARRKPPAATRPPIVPTVRAPQRQAAAPRRDPVAATPIRRFRPAPVALKTAPGGRPLRFFNPARLLEPPPSADEAVVAATKDHEIEPAFLAGTPGLVYARGGGDPKAGTYPDTEGEDEKLKEPTFLAGTDYALVTPRGLVTFYSGEKMRGEFFEPSSGRAQDPKNTTETRRLAFSAFLPGDNEAYAGTGDDPGVAVRVIGYSDDALKPSTTQPTVTRVLPPAEYGEGTSTDDEGNETSYSLFAPDASPTVFPPSSRFIAFVSLRGYTPGDGADVEPDPTTYYTSLWLWDTADDTNPPVQLLAIPGKSILHPRFSPDGRYIAFTVTDWAFPPASWAATNGTTVASAAPDIVRAFDLLPLTDPGSAFAKLAQASVWVAPVGFNTTMVLGEPSQATSFAKEGAAAKDLMPFWSELNQLGFSSDRVDADGDGFADSLPAPPAVPRFSAYTFPRPYVPPVQTDPENPKPYEDATTPEMTPSRQLVGLATSGTENALKCDWAPMAPTSAVGSASFVGNTDDANILGNNVLALLAPRLVCQTDRNGNADLWGASAAVRTVFNGHLLSDLPAVTPKQGTPGEAVAIDVDVTPDYIERDMTTDPPTLKTRVFAIVKDPDERLYHLSNGIPTAGAVGQVNRGVVTMLFREVNSGLAYFDGDSLAAYAARYAEDPAPPQIGALVELTESPAGSNHFTAQWSTPLEASDFLLDIVVDTPGGPMISDNIQGFTTAPFVPASPLLVVSDFAQGQQAIPYTTLTPSTAGVPTESYFTQRPHCDWGYTPGSPSEGSQIAAEVWADIGPRVEYQQAELLTDPGNGRLTPDPATARLTAQPLTEKGLVGPYDLWRTQCRLPISAEILKQYVPYTELQPGFPDTSTTREQRVADRCVLWFAPHAGQVDGSAGRHADQFGTLGNVVTQGILIDYLKAGGRMLLTGDDAAFTLAQDMPLSRNNLLDRFRVRYESGRAADVDTFDYAYQRTTMKATSSGNLAGLNPIPYSAWEPRSYHFAGDPPSQLALAPFFSYPRGTYLSNLTMPLNLENMREDGALTNLFIDSVVTIPPDTGKPPVEGYGGEAIFTYDDKKIAAVQTQAPLRMLNATGPSSYLENTSAYKTVFFAFGLEGIDREYGVKDGVISAWNPKALLLHNVIDFLNTGAVSGTVYLNNSTTPVNNVIVRAIDQYRGDAKGMLRCIAVSGPSPVSPNNKPGQYAVRGLDASIYRMEAYKAGYAFVNAAGATVHGGQQTQRVNLYLIPVPAGTLTGTVKDSVTGAPIAGAFVHIHDVGGALDLTAVSGSDGTYRLDSVLAGLYSVTASREDYVPYAPDTPLSVSAAPQVTTYDIEMAPFLPPPVPATINGTVVDDKDQALASATVTVLDAAGAVATTADGGSNPVTTDATGAFSFILPPGTYTVRAEIAERAPQSTVVEAAEASVTTLKFIIAATPPPTMLQGAIQDPDAAPIAGATIGLLLPTGELATMTDGGPNPVMTGAEGLYSFNVAPATYRIRAEADGFDRQTREVTVPGEQTTTFDITLQRTIIPGALSGHVRDKSSGLAVEGASVRVRSTVGGVDKTTQTDSDGAYLVTPLAPGTYTVDASFTGYDAYSTSSPITVTPGPSETVLDILLQPTIVPPKPVTLIVNLLDMRGASPAPLVGATVSVTDPGTHLPVATMDGAPNPVSTGTTGSATFHLSAGTYAVIVQATGLRDQGRTVTLAAGSSATTISFSFGGVIHTFTPGLIYLASAPYDFTGTDFSGVLGLTAAALSTSIVTYNPAVQSFLFYPAFPSDTFHLGRGYGIKIPAAGRVHDVGAAATTAADGTFAIPVSTGWNLIGNPFDATIPWDDSVGAVKVRVQLSDGSPRTYPLTEAMTRGYLVSPLWGGYNVVNGNYLAGYATTQALQPWEGRWIMASQPLTLVVPRPASVRASGRTLSTSHSPLRASADTWSLSFAASAGAFIDDDLSIGIDTRASAGYDRGKDLSKPDPMDTRVPYLTTALTPSWGSRSSSYVTDVRADLRRSDWTFRVGTNLKDTEVTLTWTPWGGLPPGTTVTLVNLGNGKRTDMTKASSYTYKSGQRLSVAAFRVELRGPVAKGRRG